MDRELQTLRHARVAHVVSPTRPRFAPATHLTRAHGRVRFVISLTSNDGEMRFRLLRTIESGL
jgi:hypothetical protein